MPCLRWRALLRSDQLTSKRCEALDASLVSIVRVAMFFVLVMMTRVVIVVVHGKCKAAEDQGQAKQKCNTQFVHIGSSRL